MRSTLSVIVAAALVVAASSHASAQEAARAQLYSGFVLVDPETATRTAEAWVVVRDGRIEHVGAGVAPSGDFDRHDMRGLYAMPGLIDAHAHLTAGPQKVSVTDGVLQVGISTGDEFTRSNAAIALAFGVTSVRNPGGSAVAAERYDGMIASGKWVGPEARHAGEILQPPPFDGESFAYPTTAAEWNAEAARQARAGMTYFKLYTDLNEEELALGVGAARAHHLVPIAHLNSVSWKRGLELGVVQFGHALPTSPALLEPGAREAYAYGADFMTRWWELADLDGPLLQDLAASLARADAAVDLTLVVNQMVYFADQWETLLPLMANPPDYFHPAQLATLGPAYEAMRGVPAEQLARSRAVWPKVLAFARLLHERGVSLMIGTDGSGGAGIHYELDNHVQAGIPVWEVLRMATSGNADLIGLTGTGRIAPGLEADMVFLRSDPVADVRNVEHVEFVVNNGTLYEREALLGIARQIAEAARLRLAEESDAAEVGEPAVP